MAQRSVQDFVRGLRDDALAHGDIATALVTAYRFTPLAAYRHAHGYSQSGAAIAFNQRFPGAAVTAKNISYWENWADPDAARSPSARPPSLVDLRRLAQMYGCLIDDLLPGSHDRRQRARLTVPYPVLTELLADLPKPPQRATVEACDTVMTIQANLGEGKITLELSRREFAALIATGGLAALLPDSLAAAADAGPAEMFRTKLISHQAGHHLLTPAQHIRSLAAILTEIDQTRQTARPPLDIDLLHVKAEVAEHLSWLHRERGDQPISTRWADHATTWAISSGDPDMAAYMILRRASTALDHGDDDLARTLATQSRTIWTLPPALDAVARLYQARASAITGVVDTGLLDTADELLAHAPRTGPSYLRFYNRGWGDLQRATCYTAGGRPGTAITILNARLTGLPSTHHRDRAIHHTRIGTAHAATGTADAAAIAAIAGLTEAQRAGSQHALAELKTLNGLLVARWPDQPKVREFAEALATA
ncbi:hypothetical protein [Rhizohabitans arisaemae]|uniref:hypothetical protein n=1 Tax=Rhizohabitans arisaemae TaxID=2720610 RepID=UPI0024B07C1D|nr:hypothetical protein [Rhizohabitans arisaemae]